jgi:hypothetical protein
MLRKRMEKVTGIRLKINWRILVTLVVS